MYSWDAYMGKYFRLKTMLSLLVVIVLVTSFGIVNAIAPYPTTPATATVDGDPSEWDTNELVTPNDFFADMYRAGDPLKVIQSKLYLRYDPSTSTLYVLVLTLDDYPGEREADEAWVKIDGAKMVDGDYDDFEWIELNPEDANYVKGFEASFTLAQGEYILDAHINVYSINEEEKETQTSRVNILTSLPLFVVPEVALGTIALLGSAGMAFIGFEGFKRRRSQQKVK